MSFRQGRGNGNSFMKNLPFGLGYSDIGSNDTTEFPSIPLPVNNPITSRERSLAVTYIKFGRTVRDGPFYTGSMSLAVDNGEYNDSSDSKITSTKTKKRHLYEAEGRKDGIERYSDRYLKKRKIGASIDDHPYHLEVFPKELFSVLGINKKKLLTISKYDNTDNIFTGGARDESAGITLLEKLKELAEDEDNSGDENAEEKKEEDLGDEDFEDEDDDDDYNAEKYFNDGDDEDYGDEDDYREEPAF